MAELGIESEPEHKQLVDLVTGLNFEKVIFVGKKFSSFLNSQTNGYFESSSDAAGWIKNQKISGATILIKGSRSSKMEVVLDAIE